MRPRQRRHRTLALVLGLAALAWATAGGGLACFSPDQPPCGFSCAEPSHRCPEHYVCGEDLLCHREGTDPALCPLTPPDASTDTP